MSASVCTLADVARRGGGVSRHTGRDGVERFRARALVDSRQISLGIYDTEDEARRVVEAAHERLGTTVRMPGAERLVDYGRAWLDRRELDGVRGIRQERSVWRVHIEAAAFATLPLRDVTRAQVVQWARAIMGVRSRQTAQHALRILRTCLAAAADDGLIKSNPIVDTKLPKRPEDDRWTWLASEEIAALLGAEDVPQWARDVWAVAIYAGLRKGELAGLRWSDVRGLEGRAAPPSRALVPGRVQEQGERAHGAAAPARGGGSPASARARAGDRRRRRLPPLGRRGDARGTRAGGAGAARRRGAVDRTGGG